MAGIDKAREILRHKYFLVIALAVVNLLVAYFYIENPFRGCSDYATYESALDYIKGSGGEAIFLSRLLTMPFTFAAALFLGAFSGSMANGFLILNIFFYFAIALVFYELALLVFNSRRIALISTVLFQGNYWLFSYCAAYSGDTGGYFFFVLSSLFALKYYLKQNKKYFFTAILAASIGVLFKEFGALGMITLGMAILFLGTGWLRKLKEVAVAALLFLVLPGLFHLWFYLNYHYSYFNWYGVAAGYPGNEIHSLLMLIKVLGWVFLAGWPIFLYSLFKIKKQFKPGDYRVALILLPASLAFFAWPAFIQRTAFVLVPWLAIYTGYGLGQVKNKYLVAAVLAIYVVVGYFTEDLLKLINIPFL